MVTVEMLEDDLADCNDVLLLSTSLYPGKALDFSISLYLSSIASLVRLGGNGGKVAGSKTGALILPASSEGALDPEVLPPPFDKVDIEEMVDDIDSFEAFLLGCCSDGRRGGKAGDGCVDCLLVGSLGGGAGAGAGLDGGSTFWPVRTMSVGGGRIPFLLGKLGSLPMPLVPFLKSLLIPFVRGAAIVWLL